MSSTVSLLIFSNRIIYLKSFKRQLNIVKTSFKAVRLCVNILPVFTMKNAIRF